MHNKHFLWIINDKNLCFGKLKSYANNTQGPVTKAEDREGGGLGLEFVSRRFIDDLDLVCLEGWSPCGLGLELFENYRFGSPQFELQHLVDTTLTQNIILFYCVCQYRGNCGLDDKTSHGEQWCNFHRDLSQSLVVPGRSSHQKSPTLPVHPQRWDDKDWRGIMVFVSKLLLGFVLVSMFLSAKARRYFFFFLHVGCS